MGNQTGLRRARISPRQLAEALASTHEDMRERHFAAQSRAEEVLQRARTVHASAEYHLQRAREVRAAAHDTRWRASRLLRAPDNSGADHPGAATGL